MSTAHIVADAAPLGTEVCVARQPIFDAALDVRGYELLFRRGGENRAIVVDAEAATSDVILNAFTEIGLERLVGTRPAWVNISQRFLVDGHSLSLPPDRVVLEILEDVVVDDDVLAAATALRRAGYTLALDDIVYTPALDPLLAIVDIAKVEILGRSPEQVAETVARLRCFPGLRLLAEKVETHRQMEACRALGFELFQGYVLCEPRTITQRTIAPANVERLRLLSEVLDPATEFEALAEIVARDVALTYKLLRYINSALFGFRRTIGSVQEALTILGLEAVRRWVTLVVMASRDDTPSELVVVGLVRGRMCERLAPDHPGEAARYFMTGLFSVLDAIMDARIEDLLTHLPLDASVAGALVEGTGDKGRILGAVRAYERGAPGDALAALGAEADAGAVRRAYEDSLDFAAATMPLL